MHETRQKSSFLSHVAGLRGWAILLIVWFHLSSSAPAMPEWAGLPFGYFGVEVFIVIMGYFLISGFSRKREVALLPFAEGKFMRLLVPTALVVLPALAAAFFVTDGDELRAMSKTASAALYGTANHQLIRSTSSYFATNASLNPFLHFWYLSVALQLFALSYGGYFILRRLTRRTVIGLLAAAAIISYAFSMADSVRMALTSMGMSCPWNAGAVSYYSTLPRLWELLAGGAILLLPELRSSMKMGILSLLGLLTILGSAICHSSAAQALSLPVVLGTMLVIRYGAVGVTKVLLCNRAALWLGAISASVYWVHMPLLVLWKQWTFRTPTLAAGAMLLVLSLVVGWGFYHAVEKRRFGRIPALIIWTAALGSALIVSSTYGLRKVWNTENNAINLPEYRDFRVSSDTSLGNGFNTALLEPEYGWVSLSLPATRRPQAPEMALPLLQLGPAEQPATYVLVGDSHAQAIYMGMDMVSRELGISGVFLGSIIEPFRDRECPRQFNSYFYNREKAAAFLHWLKSHPEIGTVVVAQLWDKLSQRDINWDLLPVPPNIESNGPALRGFCEDLRAIGKKVVIWGPLPFFEGSNMVTYARWLHRHGYPLRAQHPDFICTRSAYEAKFGKVNALLNALEKDGLCRVLHPAEDVLFRREGESGEEICRAVEDGQIAFKDKDHISVSTSLRVAERLKEQLRELLSPDNGAQHTAAETGH